MTMMRSFWALLLAIVFSAPPAFLTALSGPSTGLPACCRRSGIHKCGMAAALGHSVSSSESATQTVSGKCPFSSTRRPEGLVSVASLPFPTRIPFAYLLNHPAVHPQTEALFRISFERSRQKRGPPSFLA
jgi:hypothetical protein